MKNNVSESVPLGGAFWEGGANTFIHKGTNARWRDELDASLSEQYLAQAQHELGSECAHWLAQGSLDQLMYCRGTQCGVPRQRAAQSSICVFSLIGPFLTISNRKIYQFTISVGIRRDVGQIRYRFVDEYPV